MEDIPIVLFGNFFALWYVVKVYHTTGVKESSQDHFDVGVIFKPVVPLLNLCDAHSIVTESRLDLLNGFHLAVAQCVAKFYAVAML